MVSASRFTFYIIPRERVCNETAKRLFRVTCCNNVSLVRRDRSFAISGLAFIPGKLNGCLNKKSLDV